MANPVIRPMAADDVRPAADLLDRGDWGPFEARRSFFDFAVEQPACRPIVAEVDGQLVGTGVGTAHGRVGWVGTIFVDAPWRGRGLGAALTQAVIDDLDERGCATLVLVATDLGRPLYERLGFAEQGWYQTYEIAGLPPDARNPERPSTRLRVERLSTSDLPGCAQLDALATGEDRSAILAGVLAVAGPGPGWAVRSVAEHGLIEGFLLRPPWGGGATIARSADAAMAILRQRRGLVGPDRRVRAGILTANRAGVERLVAEGWRPGWRAIRMARGASMTWQPQMIWGQFNFAVG
ncbi:MAG: GNAT family N-acetyltransferase [Chloroflexi bacterium]|nr:GNAT family N-acetyltransferase [Chloroflexota bacterium]